MKLKPLKFAFEMTSSNNTKNKKLLTVLTGNVIVFFIFINCLVSQGFESKASFFKHAFYGTERTHSFDVLHYTLELTVPLESTYFSGTTTIKCRSLENNLTSVFFHAGDLRIQSVKKNDSNLDTINESDGITVLLPETFAKGDTFSIKIEYETYEGRQNKGFYFYERCAYTMSEPIDARYWFPCFDVPWDKATADIIVTVPMGYEAASNGLLIKTSKNPTAGTVTYHWSERHPMATYLFCVTISDYAEFSDYYCTPDGDSIEINYYVFPEDVQKAMIDFENVVDMVDFYSSRIYPYPFDKYGMAVVEPAYFGGMEHQNMTTINRVWITGDKSREGGIAHELAHMWFGDMITLIDWEHIWLNESFATYFDALYTEYKYGKLAFNEQMENYRIKVFKEEQKANYPIYAPPPNLLFGTNVYQKGAWVLHMLRSIVGDNTWWQIIRTYAENFAYKNASTDDFVKLCEQVAKRQFDWFFHQWLYETGYPVYSYRWYVEESTGGMNYVILELRQTQFNGPLYTMPVDVTIIGNNGEITQQVTVNELLEVFRFTVDKEFTTENVILDKDNKILKKISGERFTAANRLNQNFPNPFNMETVIPISISQDGFYELTIFDVKGKLVKTIAQRVFGRGNYRFTWDGTNNEGNKAASGIYFYNLKGKTFSISKKMLYLK